MDKDKPLVSICVQTYNQEHYIKQCLEGILMQKTNFTFEVLLGEDQSSDATRSICIEYANKHPETIKLFLRDRKDVIKINGNETGRYNFTENLKASKGKYIAICEGDDYWIDASKLQKQVDFLDNNPDFNICFHEVELYNQHEGVLKKNTITRDIPGVTDISELSKGNFIHTPSVMLRNNFEIPQWFSKPPTGDWALYMLALKDKKIMKLKDIMAVYRVTNNGVWSGKTYEQHMEMTISTFQLVYKNIKLNDISKKNLSDEIATLKVLIKENKKCSRPSKNTIKTFLKKPYSFFLKQYDNLNNKV